MEKLTSVEWQKLPIISIRKSVPSLRNAVTRKGLIQAVGKGEATDHQVTLLYHSVKKIIEIFVHRIMFLSNEHDVDDMCQDVFIHLLNKCDKYDEEKDPECWAWLWSVVQNKILNVLKKRGTITKHEKLMVDMSKEHVEVTELLEASEDNFHNTYPKIKKILQTALDKFADKSEWIVALLGDPREKRWQPPEKITYSEPARRIGVHAGKLSKFYKDELMPYIAEMFEYPLPEKSKKSKHKKAKGRRNAT